MFKKAYKKTYARNKDKNALGASVAHCPKGEGAAGPKKKKIFNLCYIILFVFFFGPAAPSPLT